MLYVRKMLPWFIDVCLTKMEGYFHRKATIRYSTVYMYSTTVVFIFYVQCSSILRDGGLNPDVINFSTVCCSSLVLVVSGNALSPFLWFVPTP